MDVAGRLSLPFHCAAWGHWPVLDGDNQDTFYQCSASEVRFKIVSENVGNAHTAPEEQEMDAVRGDKRSFNLSLPPGEFYRLKKNHKL